MCGIAGFVGPWPRALAEAMGAVQSHRGPDGEGFYFDRESGIGLAHRRLTILDLSDAGAQPMASACGRYLITFNGEIYNFPTLRRELEADGAQFRSTGDTEILLEAFVRFGPRSIEKLNGIFAFAIWDRQERALFIARDQLGVKPLYFADLPMGLLFASELKALTLCPDLPRDIDPEAALSHLGLTWSAGDATMLKHVRKLRPGQCLWYRDGRVRLETYYKTPASSEDQPRHGPDTLRSLLDDVVREQMISDVPIGAMLSGGVDSSAIVASMCQATDPAKVITFCVAVPRDRADADSFGDDPEFARQVARDLGVELIEVPVQADIFEQFEEMVWQLDEPIPDLSALLLRSIAAAARDRGIKVLLSGTGGDDVFTGYRRHHAAYVFSLLKKLGPGRELLGSALSLVPPKSVLGRRLWRLGNLFQLDETEMLAESLSLSGVQGPERRALLAQGFVNGLPEDGIPAALAGRLAETDGENAVRRLLDLELFGFLPDLNLNYADKMAMWESIEVRVPLADPRIVAFGAECPLDRLIDLRESKKILRESQKGRIPDSVLERPKQGFGVPLRHWLSGPARPMMEALTAPDVVRDRGIFDPAAIARLKQGFFGKTSDSAWTLCAAMAIESWCRRLDRAPVVH